MQTDWAIEKFVEHCRYRGLSKNTIGRYLWAFKKLRVGHRTVPRKPDVLMRVMMCEELAAESRLTLWRCYRRLYKWLSLRYTVPNVMEHVPPPARARRLPRVLDQAEVERLLAACTTRRDRALVLLPMDNGLRLGEIAGIRRGDMFLDHVRVDGKVGERQVPLSAAAQQALLGVGDEEHLWIGRQGPMTIEGVKQVYGRLFDRAGIRGRKLGPHTLRHTFATWYMRSGGNVRILQEILGHLKVETTMLYVHLAGRDVREDHAAHTPLRMLTLLPADLAGHQVAP